MTTNTLPHGFKLRHTTMDDLQGMTDLIIACDIADYGQPTSARATIEEYTRSFWESSSIDLATNAWVVLAPNGQHVARLGVSMLPEEPEVMYASPRVHPDYRGLGIGTSLIHLAEQRAREIMSTLPQEKRVSLNSWVEGINENAKTLLTREGFSLLRTFLRMELDMHETPPVPQWPDGFTIHGLVRGREERLIFDTYEEVFHDHWGHSAENFEDWVQEYIEIPTFEPALWMLLRDGNEVAGFSLCRLDVGEQVNTGIVDDLGVRRPWRKHGLGLALLYHSFGEFYKRGIRHVELSVDSDNLSGATGLYERAGMHRANKYDVRYEKVLREGQS